MPWPFFIYRKPCNVRLFGLIGFPLSHSFSKGFFTEKFSREQISGCTYENFPIPDIAAFPALWEENPGLEGLNVTIPYKQAVMPYLDDLSDAARTIGAVNCIRRAGNRLIGHNTDVLGFGRSLEPLLAAHHTQALVLGTGGAALAVKYALQKLNITFSEISRSGPLTYESVTPEMMAAHKLIINTTPLGMYPNVDAAPPLPYAAAGPEHLFYDLVYNPPETLFMKKGLERGAAVKNGYEMLILQAEASWEIWNS